MPFTFSHPVIILPLHSLPFAWRSMTGLVVGSVVPDFELFLKMKAEITFSHTLPGLLLFNLPLALLLTFAFHLLVRDALILNLPRFLRLRLSGFLQFNWLSHFRKHYLVFIVSVLLGIVLHVLWDGFTHKNGYFVKLFPVLLTQLEFGDWSAPLYHLLQLGFSVVGGFGIVYAILQLPVQQEEEVRSRISLRYWLLLAGITLPLFLLGMQQEIRANYLANLIVIFISSGSVALILTPVLLKLLPKKGSAIE